MSVTIRPAQTFDVDFAAPRMAQALGPVGHTLTGTTNDEDAAHVIAQFFPLRGHRLSFTHTLMAEEGGKPAGLAVIFPGELSAPLDDLYREMLRSRGLPDTIQSPGLAGELHLHLLLANDSDVWDALYRACEAQAARLNLPLCVLARQEEAEAYLQRGLLEAGKVTLNHLPHRRLRQRFTVS